MPEGIGYPAGATADPVTTTDPATDSLSAQQPAQDPRAVARRLFTNLLDEVQAGGQIPGLTSEGAGLGFDVDGLIAKYLPVIEVDDDDETGHAPDFDHIPTGSRSPVKAFSDADLGEVVPGRDGIPSGLQHNAARGAAAVRRTFGFTGTIGGLGLRSTKSDHPDGNAIDVMTGEDIETGQNIADFFVLNRAELGVTYVIFNGRIASPRTGWEWGAYRHPGGRTDPTAMHVDHPHISFSGTKKATGRIAPPNTPKAGTATRPAASSSPKPPAPARPRSGGAGSRKVM